MKRPVILCVYEKMLPGSQLLNRLEDLGYEVRTSNEPGKMVEAAEREKPMLVIVDIEPHAAEMCDAISQLKSIPATSHLPVIALVSPKDDGEKARRAGASLVVQDQAILQHLKQFLDQALQLD